MNLFGCIFIFYFLKYKELRCEIFFNMRWIHTFYMKVDVIIIIIFYFFLKKSRKQKVY